MLITPREESGAGLARPSGSLAQVQSTKEAKGFVCWLLIVPATCECIRKRRERRPRNTWRRSVEAEEEQQDSSWGQVPLLPRARRRWRDLVDDSHSNRSNRVWSFKDPSLENYNGDTVAEQEMASRIDKARPDMLCLQNYSTTCGGPNSI